MGAHAYAANSRAMKAGFIDGDRVWSAWSIARDEEVLKMTGLVGKEPCLAQRCYRIEHGLLEIERDRRTGNWIAASVYDESPRAGAVLDDRLRPQKIRENPDAEQ